MKRIMKFKRLRFLVLVLALMVFSSTVTFAAPNENSSTAFDKKVLARIDAERALKHIENLSEGIGPRIAGTKEERQAAEYVKRELSRYGYDAEIQEFDIKNVIPKLTIDSLNNKELKSNAATGSGNTGENGVTANIINCGLGLDSSNFPEEVKGNIALIQRGAISFSDKAINAVAAGAVGVILYNNVDGILNPTLGTYVSPIPVLAISKADGDLLANEVADKEIQATIKAPLYTKSWNVIAKREPKNKNKATDKIIYVTAHYDSVPYAPGANDNASGTAMLLEFARILKAYPIDKEVRFIACGAEEIGLLGSRYYVSKLSEDELSRSFANFNMDMIATSYEACNILYADTVTGEPNLVTDYAVAAGARLGNNILSISPGSSSDHAPFGDLGIPAACFIWGDENGKLEPWYHTPDDTINTNLSLDRLQQAGEIVGSALYDALRVQTPNLKNNSTKINTNKHYDFGVTQ